MLERKRSEWQKVPDAAGDFAHSFSVVVTPGRISGCSNLHVFSYPLISQAR